MWLSVKQIVHRELIRKLINYTSTHSPTILQNIKQLPTPISKQLSNNSSSEEIFNAPKYEYETALKNSSYLQTKLLFNKKEHRKQKQNKK